MANNPQQFSADFARILARAGNKAEKVMKKSAMSVLKAIEDKSPVGDPSAWASPSPAGYTGGQFRANWNLSVGSIDFETVEDTDPTGQSAINRAQGKIESYRMGDKIYISNSLPYAYRLEYEGWSGQAPQGMVRVTVLEFEQYVRQQAALIQ